MIWTNKQDFIKICMTVLLTLLQQIMDSLQRSWIKLQDALFFQKMSIWIITHLTSMFKTRS